MLESDYEKRFVEETRGSLRPTWYFPVDLELLQIHDAGSLAGSSSHPDPHPLSLRLSGEHLHFHLHVDRDFHPHHHQQSDDYQ